VQGNKNEDANIK